MAVTRKNFLFVGSDTGGDRAAVLYTLIESAKLNRLDPEAYLADVIDRMAKGHPNSRLADLLPWYWKPAGRVNETWPPCASECWPPFGSARAFRWVGRLERSP